MGKVFGPPIPEKTKNFLRDQHLFFVATAPLSRYNRVNVSPKSAREFRVIDDKTIAYVDLTGSGSETSCHLLENGRITIMFVALSGSPQIVRFYGKGHVILPTEIFLAKNQHISKHFQGFLPGQTKAYKGFRSIIVIDVERASSSCGYSIPYYTYEKERSTLDDFAENTNVESYQDLKNSFSIDGMRSYAQFRDRKIPSYQEDKKGFLFAKYEDSFSLAILYRKLKMIMKMAYAAGLNGAKRDITFFLFGFVAALTIAKMKPTPSE